MRRSLPRSVYTLTHQKEQETIYVSASITFCLRWSSSLQRASVFWVCCIVFRVCVCVRQLHVCESVTIVFIYLCNVACYFVFPLPLDSIVINSYLLLHRWVTWRNGNSCWLTCLSCFYWSISRAAAKRDRERERKIERERDSQDWQWDRLHVCCFSQSSSTRRKRTEEELSLIHIWRCRRRG